MIYLDYAAATPMNSEALAAMMPYLTDRYFNPSAGYMEARNISADIAAARSLVAQILGARSSEVIFTAGGTEANNLAITGIMQQYPEGNIIVSSIEHDSVVSPASRYALKTLPVNEYGIASIDSLRSLIDDKTILISLMYANNEIGTIQPVRQAAEIIKTVRRERLAQGNLRPLLLHTDACQAANYLDIHVSRLGVDLMTLNGGKIYGPKQSGMLYIRAGVNIEPIILGGGQERNVRSGTENVAAIIGFSKAMEITQAVRHEEVRRLAALQNTFITLVKTHIPNATLNGSLKLRLPNNVHITIPGYDNERLLFALNEMGIMAAAGSACSASKEQASQVLTSLGMTESDVRSSLRFTMGRMSTDTEISHAVNGLAKIVTNS